MSELNESRMSVRANKAKIVVATFTAIGIVLMTTLAILPNTTGNVQANPCSGNHAGNGGNSGNGGNGGNGGSGTGTGTGKTGGGVGFGIGTGLGFGATGAPGGAGGPGATGGSVSCVFNRDVTVDEGP